MNGDNMDNVRHEARRTIRTKRWEYSKDNINEIETNSKNKNIRDLYRGTNKFKGYQPRSNFIKDENGNLLADSHSILNRWKNYFCQLLNVHGVNDVKQTEIHAAELLEPEPGFFKVEIATEKLKMYKSPGTEQILAEFMQAEGNTLCSEIHNLLFLE
jgi:hypothetical protein